MEKITREELLKLAQMSQIQVHEDEIEDFINDISAVLGYASTLKDIASKYQERYSLPKNSSVMRDDNPRQFSSHEILACSPEREGDFFVVPRIIKQG